jgi:hypothetical protein
MMAATGTAQFQCGLPFSLPTVQLAATASRAVLRTVARDRLRRPWTGDGKSHFCRNRPECQPGF